MTEPETGALRSTLVSTGSQQEANPGRQSAAVGALDARYTTAVKSQTHLWLVVLSHFASDQFLDAQDGVEELGLGLLDLDTMAGAPGIACYVCEQPYEPRLRRRKCPGEASPQLMAAKGYTP